MISGPERENTRHVVAVCLSHSHIAPPSACASDRQVNANPADVVSVTFLSPGSGYMWSASPRIVAPTIVTMSDNEACSSKPCTFIFKKSTAARKGGLRRRQQVTDKDKESDMSDMSSSSGDETRIVTKDRKKKANPLIQSTRTFSGVKRRLAGKVGDASSSDDDDGNEDGKSIVSLAYKSDRTGSMSGPRDAGATATTQIDTEADKDARAIFERARRMEEEGVIGEDDKTYKGINNYKKFIVAKDNTAGSFSRFFATIPFLVSHMLHFS